MFVIATGVAAFTHSTWTLATAFGGPEPSQGTSAWWYWVIPGALIAFSFDIGQIAVSVELRNGERTRPKYATFAVLAMATYYLQWFYMASHMPRVELSQGVAPEFVGAASLLRAIALWIVPGLLPLATTLYTWSYAAPKRTYAKPTAKSANREQIDLQPQPIRSASDRPALPQPSVDALWIAECAKCGWRKPCDTERKMINSLNAHMRFCPANVDAKKD
jgi:hypothetical protein